MKIALLFRTMFFLHDLRQRMIVMALCAFFLAACERTQSDQRPAADLGIEPVPRVIRCSESIDVFIDLAERGRKGITVLHLSGRGNMSPLPRDRMAELRDLVKKKRWDAMQVRPDGRGPDILGANEYLYAAARFGMVKEVIWVLPFKWLDYSDAERRIQAMLASEGYDGGDVAGMRFRNGCVSGTLSDIPVSICGVETLPRLAAPVTLDIDAGFFPVYAQMRRMTVLAGIKDLFEKWTPRQVPVHEAFVRTTLREEGMTPLYLYVGGIVHAVLEKPSLVNMAPPETWFLVNMAAGLVDNSPVKDAAEFIRQARKRYPEDHDLRMLGGIVESLGGSTAQGLDILSRLCSEERDYCSALGYAGRKLEELGRRDEAEKFFHAAGGAVPGVTKDSALQEKR